MFEHFYDITEPLHYTKLKAELEAKGFERDKFHQDRFHRVTKFPWWKFWLKESELVIVGHLVWFYEKTGSTSDSHSRVKCWGRSTASLEGLMENL